jgi:hypothetical protein
MRPAITSGYTLRPRSPQRLASHRPNLDPPANSRDELLPLSRGQKKPESQNSCAIAARSAIAEGLPISQHPAENPIGGGS